MNNNRKKPSKQELEALNKCDEFNKESNKDSKRDPYIHPAKDENLETPKKLAWIDDQIQIFLDTTPPDITGICKLNGWTFPQGETSLLIAQGGTGKSYFLLALMLALATGIKYGEFEPKRKYKVLGLFGEDCETIIQTRVKNIVSQLHLDDIQYRYDLKNFNAQSVINMRLVEFGDHQNPKATDKFKELCELLEREQDKGQPVDILILDPLIRFYGLNENDNQNASFFIDTIIGELQRKYGVTTILSHHVPKANSKGAVVIRIKDIEQISPRGAGAFLDNCRYALAMLKVRKDEAKDYGIKEEDYKNYVAIKPIKNNYTGEIANPSFLRRYDQGVLMPSNPQSDLNDILNKELYSCILDYYTGDLEVTTESKKGKVETEKAELPPIDERSNLCLTDLKKNTSKDPKVKQAIEIIHKRMKKAGMKNIQDEIGLRIQSLVDQNKILKINSSKNKFDIVLKKF